MHSLKVNYLWYYIQHHMLLFMYVSVLILTCSLHNNILSNFVSEGNTGGLPVTCNLKYLRAWMTRSLPAIYHVYWVIKISLFYELNIHDVHVHAFSISLLLSVYLTDYRYTLGLLHLLDWISHYFFIHYSQMIAHKTLIRLKRCFKCSFFFVGWCPLLIATNYYRIAVSFSSMTGGISFTTSGSEFCLKNKV